MYINFCYVDVEDINVLDEKKKVRTKIEVENHELGYTYFWDIEKFTFRYLMIRQLLD